jgi:hypothetical protein
MYTLPQEIEVWYIIPGIRRELARCLIKDHKITYEKVGKILGISKAAISQYLKNKRAAKIKLHIKVNEEICKSCSKIVQSKTNSVREITRILKFIRENNLHCEVCGKIIDDELHDCKQVIPRYSDLE